MGTIIELEQITCLFCKTEKLENFNEDTIFQLS